MLIYVYTYICIYEFKLHIRYNLTEDKSGNMRMRAKWELAQAVKTPEMLLEEAGG